MKLPLRVVWRLAGRERRSRWLALVAIAVVAGLMEAVGAGVIFVLLAAISSPETAPTLPLIGELGDVNTTDGRRGFLIAVGCAAAFFVARGSIALLQTYLLNRVAYNSGADLSTRLLDGYLRLPFAFHLSRNSSELVRNVFATVNEIVGYVYVPLVTIASESLIVLGVLSILLVTAPEATILTVAVLLPVVLLVQRSVQPQMARLGGVHQEQSQINLQILQESFNGIRELKLNGASVFFIRRFTETRRRLSRAYYVRAVLTELPRVSIETLALLFVLTFLAITILTGGALERALPVLGLFAYAVLRVLPSLNRIIGNLNNLKFGGAAIDILSADLDLAERVTAAHATEVQSLPFDSQIELHGVTFAYEGQHDPAVVDIDLVIPAGQSLGVVGHTGGGKSTLVDILIGLLPPASGTVLVDGHSIAGVEERWQRQIAMVPQSVFLVDASLRRNIALGVDDDAIDEARVLEAVRLAQLGPDLERMPAGLGTQVGERGVRLSGGQRQRVAIARALYRQPKLLVLDEGTAALDNRTEDELTRAIAGLKGRLTMVTIAHRLSTIETCDRVIVLEHGRVTDAGTFDELSRRHPLFRRVTS